jgi:PPOX class probable F420-dependent enzyme
VSSAEPISARPYMPGYGVAGAADARGLLPWAWAVEQLERSRNFWLATRWPDGRPHVMVVWAIWHRDALWFSSGKDSRKARNLANDPRCVLTTEDPQQPVVVEGVAELLTARMDLETLLAIENAKYGTDYGPEMVDPALNRAYRLRPGWAFGLIADEFTGSPTRWTFPAD